MARLISGKTLADRFHTRRVTGQLTPEEQQALETAQAFASRAPVDQIPFMSENVLNQLDEYDLIEIASYYFGLSLPMNPGKPALLEMILKAQG